MKPTFKQRLLFGSISLALTAPSAFATVLYYDNNPGGASFGTAGGTWAASTDIIWTASTTGNTSRLGNYVTTLSDDLNFGNSVSTGLAAGTILVTTPSAGTLTFGSASGPIVLSGGTITLKAASSITVANASNTISSVLAGAGTSLTKAGTGTVILSGASTYTGTTIVGVGTITAGGNAPSGSAGVLGNATSEVQLGTAGGSSAASVLIGGAFTVGRNIRIATTDITDAGTRVLTLGGSTAANSIFSGNVFLGTANQAGRGLTLTAATGGQSTFSGVIQNPVGMDATTYTVTKSGAGTVVFSNTNTYTGATSITAGTLTLGDGTGNLGSLSATSGITVTGAILAVNRTGAFTQATDLNGNIISGTGGFSQIGSGTTTLSLANTYTGNTLVSGGTLNITGSIAGLAASSKINVAPAAGNAVVNYNGGTSTLQAVTGATVAGTTSAFNMSGGTVNITPGVTTGTQNVVGASSAYGYYNITGGTFRDSTGTAGGARFTLANRGTASATNGTGTGVQTAVIFVGGTTGFIDHTNAEWWLNYSLGQITVADSGKIDHTGSNQPFAIFMDHAANVTGGGYGVLNLAGAGAQVITGAQPIRFGNSATSTAGSGQTGFVNVAAGTLSVGSNANSLLPIAPVSINNAYFNFAGGTVKATAALSGWIPLSSASINYNSNIFGTIDNSAVAGAPANFTGGLTVDSNAFAVTIANALQAPAGSGVRQADLSVSGGSGYVGAPAVIFSSTDVVAGGTPAAGYALINAGAVTGIVITAPGTYTPGTIPTVTLIGGGGTGASVTAGALNTANTGGGLTKINSGTLTLSGANTYTGPTLVSGGTLQHDDLAAVGPFTTSGTSVGNSGSLGFTTGTASILNLASSPLSLGGGTLAFDIGAGINDSVTVDNFSLTGNSFVVANPIGAFTNGGSYTVLTSASPIVTGGFSLSGTTVGRLSVTPTVNTNTVTITPTLAEGVWNFDGSENWDTGANWTSYKPTVAGDAALFGSVITNPAVVTVDIAQTVGYLRFNNANAYTIGTNGSSNLTLDNVAAPALVAVTSGSHTIAENVALTSNLQVAPLTGTSLTVSGNLSGPSKTLQLIEAGTLVLSGAANTFTGATTINTGTLSLTGSLTGGGAVTVSGNGVLNESSTGVISGTSSLTHSSSGSSTLSGANTYSGATNVTNGTLTVAAAGSITTASTILLNVSGASAVANIDGTYTSTGGGGVAVNSGGVLNTSGTVAIGGINNQALLLGTAGGSGTWNVTNGSVSVNYASNGWGISNGGDGTLNVSGGSVTTAATNIFSVGFLAGGTGNLTISGSGLVTLDPGAGIFSIGRVLNATGVVNLDGGTLALGRNITKFSTATGTFNFNGGLLKAGLSSATYMTGLTNANVRDGGAKIDTNTFNVTIGQPLIHSIIGGDNATDGGLTKSGTGTLTLAGANTYTGPTSISGGTLQLDSSAAVGPFTTSGTSVGSSGTLGFTTGAASILNLAASPLTLGGTLAFDIGASGVNDSVTVDNFSLTGNSFVAVTPIGAFTNGGSYTVLTSASPIVTGGFSLSGTTVGRLSVTPTVNTNTVTITPTLDEGIWNFDGSGNWNTPGNWLTYQPTVAGDAALFGSVITNPAVVTVDTAQTVGYLRFNNSNAYTIGTNGSSNLTLDNVAVPALVAVTSGSHTIAENVALTSNLLVVPLTGTTLTVSGNLSGAGKTLQLVEAGTLELSGTGNSYTGTTTVSAGTLSLTGSLTGGGAVTVSGNGVLSQSATGVISGAASVTHAGSGTSTLAGINTYTGVTTVSTGTLILSGNRTAQATGGFTVGNVTGSTGTLNVTDGTFTVGATALSNFLVGSGTASTGIMNQSGSSLTTIGNQLLVGNGTATGTYNLSGGTLTTIAGGLGVTIGVNTGTTGTFNLSGTGTLTMPATSTLQISRSDGNTASGVTGTFNQTGGTATVGILRMGGSNSTPANNAGANSTLTLSGGTFAATTFAVMSGADTSSSVINIGGTANVTLPAFPTTRGSGSTATINFDGGTLKPAAASATYMGGLTNAFIKAGGAKFDTTGFDITVTQELLTDVVSTGGGLTKAGTNTLTLAGTNTYTGGTTIAGGILSVTNANALSNGAVTFNGGAQLLVATGLNVANAITVGVNTAASSVGMIQPGTTAGTATLSGPITINNASAAGGHFAAPTAGTVLHVAGAITSAVQVSQRLGTVIFSGGGTGYSSMIATGTTIVGANNGIATTAAVTIGGSAASTLDLNGYNQSLVGIIKGGSAATIGNSSTTADSVLTTTGTSSYAGIIQDVISPGTRKVNLAVASGALTLTGANTFSGDITVANGTLVGAGATNSPGITAFGSRVNTRTITVNTGGTLQFNSGNILGTNHTAITAPTLIINNGGVVTNGSIATNNALNIVQLNGGTLTSTTGHTSSSPPNLPVYGAWNLNGSVASTGTSTISTSDPTKGWIMLKVVGDKTTDFNVTSGTLTVSAPVVDNPDDSNIGSLSKSGAGAMILSGVNTYTGNTNVSAGSLTLADNAQLKFVIGATSGTNNSVGGAGTLTVDGDFNIDTTLTDATALTTGSWTLVDASTLAETFNPSFTIVGAGWSENANVWTKTVGAKKYTFTEASGILVLSPAASYASWIDGFFPGEGSALIIGATADPDNDGIENGVEMVIGGNPATGMDTALLPTIEMVNADPDGDTTFSDYLLFTYRRSDLSITAGVTADCETSTNLVAPWTAATGAPGVVIQVDNNFVFTPPAAADTDRVRVYVPRGANTKLFGRLNVVVTP